MRSSNYLIVNKINLADYIYIKNNYVLEKKKIFKISRTTFKFY